MRRIIKPRLLELGVRRIRDGTINENVARKYGDLGSKGVRVLLITDPRKTARQMERFFPSFGALKA
jgi:hypothetical protein